MHVEETKVIKILFLLNNLPGYFEGGITHLLNVSKAEVLVCKEKDDSKAPFENFIPQHLLLNKEDFCTEDLLNTFISFNPKICYVTGWKSKQYLKIVHKLKKSGVTIVSGLDNPWRGDFRQRVGMLLSQMLKNRYFDYIWVSGMSQYQFAKGLGFKKERILKNLYIADTANFSVSKDVYSKKILFVGRLEKEKNIELLVQCFGNLTEEERNGWMLTIIGNGSLKQNITDKPYIVVKSFMQPSELQTEIVDAGAFILPSRYEPWGVVVQEFAMAGLPLILSDKVNAGEEYLINGYNGYSFKYNNMDSLKKGMIKIFNSSEDQLKEMGMRSKKLASRNDYEIWANTLLSVLS